jgi:pyruvate,water dikinase
MFSEMGVFPETLEYREIGGWVYTRLVPPGGEEGKAPSPELIRERVERSTETVRSDRFGKYLDQWPQWRSEFVAGVAELRDVDLGPLDDQALVGHLAEVMQFTLRAFDIHFLLHGINAVMLADLAFTCRDLLGWDDVRTLELLSGLSEASTEPAAALAGLTAIARKRPAVRRFIESGAEDASRLSEVDPEFAAAFSAYQGEFGFRTVRYEVAEPSIEETPSLTLSLVADQLRSGYDPAARAAEVARRREAVRAEARELLAGRPEADRARFERVLDRAERWYPIREDNAPMTVSEPFALIRRVALEMGRRLAESSVIDDPGDVFFLETGEAGAALAARADADCRDLVRRRQAERAWVLAHPGPATYGSEPTPPVLGDLPAETRFVNEALVWLIERSGHFVKTSPQEAGPGLTGVPASGGSYTGPVRVLWSEADFEKLQPGDVLVCPVTSPAWSVLFPKVGALVTDAGGLLSHPAIIAREFHIPAVVGTGNATALLGDSQQATVDGTAGSVEVLA